MGTVNHMNKKKMASGEDPKIAETKRLDFKKQSLDDAYAAPANLLEIEVCDPDAHGFGRQRYTDYEIKMRVCIYILYLIINLMFVCC